MTKFKKLAMCLLISISASACSFFERDSITLENDTDVLLKYIMIDYGQDVLKQDVLGPNEEIVFKPKPKTDGAIILSYEQNGAEKIERFYYVMPDYSSSCFVAVKEVGINVDCQMNE